MGSAFPFQIGEMSQGNLQRTKPPIAFLAHPAAPQHFALGLDGRLHFLASLLKSILHYGEASTRIQKANLPHSAPCTCGAPVFREPRNPLERP